MTTLQAFILGVLQGLTEFLPISSSGHLAIFETFMGLHISPTDLQSFDVLLHAGTALALLLCFWKTWWKIGTSFFTGDRVNQKLFWLLVIATIPGAVAGYFFEEAIAEYTRPVRIVAITFLINAAVLLWAHFASKGTKTTSELTTLDTFLIGVAQMFALPAGISRSALTISAGQLQGLSRREALDFSFLILFPILLGAAGLTLVRVAQGAVVLPSLTVSTVGFLTSFIASTVAIASLRLFVARYSLVWFVFYLVPISVILLLASA